MFMTMLRSSSDSPVDNDNAFSMSSWIRRMCASTSIVRSNVSGSDVIRARIEVPVRVTTSARALASPSTMMLMPPPPFAICRMTPTVPTRYTSSGSGSSLSFRWSTRNIRRSAASARFTDSIDTGRLTASGCNVSGNATVRRSGRMGSSDGSVGGVGSAMRLWSV
jgi:hypothetical protein